jgi:hypothetical protein
VLLFIQDVDSSIVVAWEDVSAALIEVFHDALFQTEITASRASRQPVCKFMAVITTRRQLRAPPLGDCSWQHLLSYCAMLYSDDHINVAINDVSEERRNSDFHRIHG